MRIGLFFGSFDPIHIGHINVGSSVLNMGLVDEVDFIVAYNNPWKKKQTPFEHRWMMVANATQSEDRFRASRIEKQMTDKNKDTHTYNVINEIKRRFGEGNEIIIITTQETYAEMPNWEHGKELIDENKFIIISSDHFGSLKFTPRECDEVIDVNDLRVNSTMIRAMLKENQITLPFLFPNTITYIRDHTLYKE